MLWKTLSIFASAAFLALGVAAALPAGQRITVETAVRVVEVTGFEGTQFARDADGAVWQLQQVEGGWDVAAALGGEIQGPLTVGRNRDGEVQVTGRGRDGAIWSMVQTADGQQPTWQRYLGVRVARR